MPLYQDEEDNAIFQAFVQDYTTKVIRSCRLERARASYNGLCFSDQTRGWAFSEDTENASLAVARACCCAAVRKELPGMQTGELVQFTGTGGNVGFASSEARIERGDRIIAFRDCHVGFVVRSLPGSSCLQIISVADVETAPRRKRDVGELEGHRPPPFYSPMEDPECEKAYVLMDFRTLQQLTAGVEY
ncbi:heterokaryon incompatibility protein [Colletotrichum graminicola M1.001]|uniref:Heterokaryon incompatibility protein n=1 Tax=Colletotrichum graminicola (strain M1.001 / M2 / FGSC 10212) TaxID=645133 RepID=E3Q8V4_COLGM|nr:heterokaryon incompatibility protein [Colletotrichum graminicola M1.001]EFQ27468.1 heterokaryon incompatibility protein [Colletotrichum graminicola M1.001]